MRPPKPAPRTRRTKESNDIRTHEWNKPCGAVAGFSTFVVAVHQRLTELADQ